MEVNKIKATLLETSLCHHLTPDELGMISLQSKLVKFHAGDIILKQGKLSPGIFIIVKGLVIVTVRILGEGIEKMATLKHGHFLGEISAIERGPCEASVVASDDVYCLLLSNEYLSSLSQLYPEIKHKILLAITEQICERIKFEYQEIIKIINQSKIVTRSIFSDVINAFSLPKETSLEAENIDLSSLKTTAFFQDFTAQQFSDFIQHTRLLKIAKHSNIIKQGSNNNCCYLVIKGAVQSSIVHENKITKLAVLGPSSLFFGLALVDKESLALIDYSACENVLFLEISGSEIEKIKVTTPSLWYEFYERICKSLVALEHSANKLNIRLNSESYNR